MERIDANLLNVPIGDIADLPKQMFETKVTNLASEDTRDTDHQRVSDGLPAYGHFRSLLQELALKKSFRPDIIFIDYLNICASSRYRKPLMSIHIRLLRLLLEELRGLAVEAKRPYHICSRPLVLVMVALTLNLLILVSPLVSLLLLILCLPYFY